MTQLKGVLLLLGDGMKKRILLIDDDVDFLLLLERYLKFPDCATDISSTGQYAVRLLNNNEYKIVISDYNIPDVCGTELIRKIKTKNSQSQVFIISGNVNGLDKKLTGLDIYGIYEKPINLSEFKKVIKQFK